MVLNLFFIRNNLLINVSGLYGPTDSVLVLTSVNYREAIFNRPIASFVEFYNSYCGACQRFATTWKAAAQNVSSWKSVVQMGAIDCASDENNDVCRQYEIMRYPTMRYFPPHYPAGDKQFGLNLDHLLVPQNDELIDELTSHLVNETGGGAEWPKFNKFEGKRWTDIFDDAALDTKYVYVVNDDLPGYLPEQVILDHLPVDSVTVRIVDPETSDLITDSSFQLGVVGPQGTFHKLSILNESRASIATAINEHLKLHHHAVRTTSPPSKDLEVDNSTDSVDVLLDRFYYDKARSTKPIPLYRADLEQAIRNTLNHEIVQHETIAGESLAALRNFVSVLTRYYSYGSKSSYRQILNYLMEPSRSEYKGVEIQNFLQKLDPPIVRDGRYIGCFSTVRGLRRFPCSLWSLFHHLTVQHMESEDNEDPMEILHAMHGYITHFFGCTDCSKHFQEMARRNHIWNVTSKDQAVLWLWSAHNEVNERLAGDVTEDKNHPKIQFPAEDHCHVCRKKNGEWDKTEVLEFLRRHFGNDHVNDLGMDQLPRALKLNARARQIFAGGAGDTHLNIGILAYVVIIIGLMIVAVRFYFRRGYRKKLYHHDILGKV